jgi:tetratricopeptide (TPR) repeat protein
MNAHLERGLLLFQQSRPELAEAELRQALAIEPHDSIGHALLALCLAQREQFKDATAEAQQAIHLQPDSAFAHYAHAHVLNDRNRPDEALPAIEEAIRLDSVDADYFALLAAIHFKERRWPRALSAAEQGLQFDPEHISCTNLRAMAMVKLGRRAEAGLTIDAALAKNPESSVTHANQGWTLLEKGEPKKALEHFRESLRLDPENEWARTGIVEALKARNVVYAVMLKYFLFMARFSTRAQWAIVLGGYFGSRFLGMLADSNPSLAPWLLPVRILYVCFALMTWMASPFFNLLLRMNRFGRLVLSREETVASNWFGACLFCAMISVAGWLAIGPSVVWQTATMVFGFLLLPVAGVFLCPSGGPRILMAVLAAGVAALGLGSVGEFAVATTQPTAGEARATASTASDLFTYFLIGAVGSGWLVNILRSQRRKR